MISTKEFFDSYWLALERRGWEAVILHSWQNLPDVIDSDVDYAVRGPTPRELLCFLSQFAKSLGWRLVQAIEHEPKAIFCVCQQAESPFESIQLDVAWLYRREGHVLLNADLLFQDHYAPQGKAFRVMSAGAEFSYLLAKAAAKGKSFDQVTIRLSELLIADPDECVRVASHAFGQVPVMGSSIQDWETWFASASAFAAVRRGRRFGIEELLLYGRRMLNPTGFCVTVDSAFDASNCDQMKKIFSPSFRGVVWSRSSGLINSLRSMWGMIRSKLIIQSSSTKADCKAEVLIRDVIEAMAKKIEGRCGIENHE